MCARVTRKFPPEYLNAAGKVPDLQNRENPLGFKAEPEFLHFRAAANVEPKSAGVSTVRMPAAAIAAYLSFAVPWPPLMMAPAWPMRRPGGAVCPAMKPTTGFFTLALIHSAARSSA